MSNRAPSRTACVPDFQCTKSPALKLKFNYVYAAGHATHKYPRHIFTAVRVRTLKFYVNLENKQDGWVAAFDHTLVTNSIASPRPLSCGCSALSAMHIAYHLHGHLRR